ncbi:5-oxoprolinase subunit PxpB [Gracilibacillus thailandensis]|uniref:5-oxoprolinase subunit PxpB n=1 Tax=Gracilibacillus thailandensis TaxID=563735 RepID=A0A6N7R0D4_9BACI|nr:5-oxoprolinase subunit PxpB [Gracilibacillus thailandensis]MRI67234.1 5-oxoprolinase subunit PxpB [Gracilibacillus thailandensis]
MRLQSISENAIMMTLQYTPDSSAYLIAVKQQLENQSFIVEAVVGYRTLTVYFDPLRITHQEMKKVITAASEQKLTDKINGRLHHIPVCYDKTFGIDMAHVMKNKKLSWQKVVALHSTPTYNVSFLGFSPGFPFLTGMDQTLATPRKDKPRLEVPQGSVGIAGGQTGIYPSTSPGGWQIIGRTPVNLLPLADDRPTLLAPGDQIRFYPITKMEFEQLQNEERIINDH